MPSISVPCFLQNYTILLDKIPKYKEFEGKWVEPLDYPMVELISKSTLDVFDNRIKSSPQITFTNKIFKNIDKNTGVLTVKSHYQANGLGRFYPTDDVSISTKSKIFKHTLFHYLGWKDIDIKKSHATIISEIIKKSGDYCPFMDRYISSFDDILVEAKEYYGDKLEKDHLKYLFNMSIYGGHHSTWYNEVIKGDDNYLPVELNDGLEKKPFKFYDEWVKELLVIQNKIYTENPALAERLLKTTKLQEKIQKIQNNDDKSPESKKWSIEKAKRGSLMSYWCGIIENQCLYHIYKYLVKAGIMKEKQGGLEMDGINIPPIDGVEYDEEVVIDEINTLLKHKTGLGIRVIFKGFDEENICKKLLELREEYIPVAEAIEITDTEDMSEYQKLKVEFEKQHTKITDKSFFITKTITGEFIIRKKQQMIDAYEHMNYSTTVYNADGKSYTKKHKFISDWLCDDTISTKRDVGMYPPSLSCPDDIYNMWVDFEMEKITEWVDKSVERDELLGLIKLLCNHDEEVYNYICKWIGQMIMFPHIKTTTPVFISDEGAGKGTLMRLLERMLGRKKIYETADPLRDVFGNFNNMMANSFLVNMNEISIEETSKVEGKIKALITDDMLTINSKGVGSYTIHSYHRFMYQSNNENCIKTTKGGRRLLIVRASDEKCGDKEYFGHIYDLLKDDNVIKTIYEWFKNLEGLESFHKLPLPITEFQEGMNELSVSPIEYWLKEWAETCDTDKISTNDMSKLFVLWYEKTYNRSCKTSTVSFGVQLGNLIRKNKWAGIEKKHSNKGYYYSVDVNEFKKSIGVGCLIDI